MTRTVAVIVLGLALALASSCARKAKTCGRRTSSEECAWKKATEAPDEGKGTGPKTGDEGRGDDPRALRGLDQMFADIIEVMEAGMDREVVEATARGFCASETRPGVAQAADEPALGWVCDARDAAVLGIDMKLEVGSGVVSVTASELPDAQSAALLARMQSHWASWCAAGRFTALEGAADEEMHRCALPGGPILVVARFPNSGDGTRFQVSVAVMAAS